MRCKMPVFISHLSSNCKNCDIYVDKRSEMNSIEMFRNVCNEKSFNHASVVLPFKEALRKHILLLCTCCENVLTYHNSYFYNWI